MLALLSVAIGSLAQEKKGNEYLSFTIGPSFPTGNISAKASDNHIAGFATTGVHLSGTYQYFENKQFAFTVQIKGQYIPLNRSELADEYNNKKFYSLSFWNGVPPPPPPSYSMYNNWNFNNGGWIITSMMAGFEGTLPLKENNQWAFTFHGLLGGTYIWTPHYKGQSTTDTSVILTDQKSNGAFGFSYQAGIGLKYSINKKMFALLQGNYTGTATFTTSVTTTEYSTVMNQGSLGGQQSTFSTFKSDVKQTVSSVNIGVGLGFHL